MDIRFIPRCKMRSALTTKTQLCNILTAQRLSQVAELHRFRVILILLVVRVCGWVDGENLVVA